MVLPYEPSWSKPVYHLYVVRTGDRDKLMAFLKEQGIGTGIHYPIPLHLQTSYRSLHYSEGSFGVVELAAKEIVSLPMYPHLTAEQQKRVLEAMLTINNCQTRDEQFAINR